MGEWKQHLIKVDLYHSFEENKNFSIHQFGTQTIPIVYYKSTFAQHFCVAFLCTVKYSNERSKQADWHKRLLNAVEIFTIYGVSIRNNDI